MDAPSSPSPLAAPNTPIASAKRLRHKIVPRSDPRSASKLSSPDVKPLARRINVEDNECGNPAKKLNYKVAKRPLESNPPPTPSKIMFSPHLRDSNDRTTVNGPSLSLSNHSVDKCESIDTDLDISDDSMNYPAEEIKQTSMIAEEEEEDVDDSKDNMDDEVDEDDCNAFNPYLFISELPPHETVVEVGKICLPEKCPSDSGRKTLVLDLDETLVHCTVAPVPNPDLIFPVLFNGTVHEVYVRKRPYLDHFLETVSKQFEVVLFTASQRVYADVLLDKLDPKRQYIKHRLFREACLVVEGNYLKDLTVLNRDLRHTMLVDNSPYAYSYHTSNGVPIESWYDDANDTELLKLINFLRRIHTTDDVRPVIRNHFKTHELIARARAGRSVPLTAPPF